MLCKHIQSPIITSTLIHIIVVCVCTCNVLLWCGAGLVTPSLIFSFPSSAEGLGRLVNSVLGKVVMKIDMQLLHHGAFGRKLLIQKYWGTI